jgi:molecular chaperone IbpA
MTTYYKSLLPSTVGFDRLLSTIEDFESVMAGNKLARNPYPPYNIVKESENDYKIEIAISGFKREDIEITLEKSKLTVTGVSVDGDLKKRHYLHKGIASRNFTHVFTLNDTVIVKDADIVDGLLVVTLENIIPEQNKPRKIPIGTKDNDLLT